MPRCVEGVRYNSAGNAVLCEHCDVEIPRGDDYAVQLNCPEEGINGWIGPYCRDCMPKLKVCSCCNKAYFGDDIKYLGSGNWYCHSCIDSQEMCGDCGTLSEDLTSHGNKKYCKQCFDKKYFKCNDCGKTKTKARSLALSTALSVAKYPSLFKDGVDTCDLCMKGKQDSVEPKKVYECKSCGEIHASDGNDYCSTCLSNIKPCGNCGGIDHLNQLISVDGGLTVLCRKCNSKAVRCQGCSGMTLNPLKKEDIFGESMNLCQGCGEVDGGQCTKCLKFGPLVDGVCQSCREITGNTCSGCGTETIYNERSNCRACDSGLSEVLNYSYKPNPLIFHYTDGDLKAKDNLFLGFELELTVKDSGTYRNTALHRIYKSGKYSELLLDATEDGSINGNGGFELVSYPMSYDYFKSIDWSSLFLGMQEHSSCGMHVHLSRSAIKSKLHEYKLISFVYENEVFIDEIAGRSYTSYNSKTNKKHSALALGNTESCRNSRVNLNNRGTIELRYFSSTTSLYTFKARVQHVHSLVKYLENAGVSEVKKGTDGYFKYIGKNKVMYPELYKFINSKQRPWNGGDVAKKKEDKVSNMDFAEVEARAMSVPVDIPRPRLATSAAIPTDTREFFSSADIWSV